MVFLYHDTRPALNGCGSQASDNLPKISAFFYTDRNVDMCKNFVQQNINGYVTENFVFIPNSL